jgi:6-phospho-beta-glucosidase
MAKKATGKGLTLAVLGGGSFYTPSFIGTMCRKPEVFANAEVRLNDPDSERVALVKAFCEVFTRAKNVPMSFASAPELDRALDGADFVITTFRIGGIPSLDLDEAIPPRFGYYGDETAGPGGMFMAIRTAPVVLDVAGRMARLCPDAWLLNYANPTNFVADALRRAGYPRTVGLCDGFICPPNDIGVSLGIEPKQILTRHVGVNHCSWTYRAEFEGRDLLEELRRATPQQIEKNLADALGAERARGPMRWFEIFRLAGLYPAPAGHMMCHFFHDEMVERQRTGGRRPHSGVGQRTQRNWDSLKAVLDEFNMAEAEKVAKTHFGAHADLAIGVAAALAQDTGELFPANVPNNGAAPGFSDDTVLENYCIVGRGGFQPQPVPRFPDYVLAQQSALVAFQQLTVRGILEKDRHLLLQALALHPFTKSIAKARELFEAMWEEEKAVLGPYWAD